MTVEAEAIGSQVALGSPLRPPRVEREAYPDVPTEKLRARDGRQQVTVEALRILAREAADVAVFGNVVGPASAAAMIVEPGRFWRALRRRREAADGMLDQITTFLTAFAEEQVEAGAEVVVISEPSGTGQILSPADFERFVLPYLNRMGDAVRRKGARVIVHICGQLKAIAGPVAGLEADALSVDAVAKVHVLREAGCRLPLMGNVSTFLLQDGPVEAIRRAVRAAREQGFAIVAPACGVSAATPVAHLRAMAEAARGAPQAANPEPTSFADSVERR
jgi:[methyl-Co(III) methanol-specific corrinoid protein]:coenzyme M methyltransferase